MNKPASGFLVSLLFITCQMYGMDNQVGQVISDGGTSVKTVFKKTTYNYPSEFIGLLHESPTSPCSGRPIDIRKIETLIILQLQRVARSEDERAWLGSFIERKKIADEYPAESTYY